MSHYMRDDNVLWPIPAAPNHEGKLPLGTYSVGLSPKGWFLTETTDFKITGKIYGDPTKHAERFLNTYESRSASTGVLLTGEKGSGKTLLGKMLSQKAAERGMSTLLVNNQFAGEGFNLFIQSINEPCLVLFDEFEKVYDDQHQQALLTLLDGTAVTKKLFVITTNEKGRINQYMQNRPGRIFYVVEYGGLTEAFIREYCEDNLDAKEHIATIARLASLFETFNFDMLKALVEEMNRYKETPHEALALLNIKPVYMSRVPHHVTVKVGGEEIPSAQFHPSTWSGSPLHSQQIGFNVALCPYNVLESDDEDYREQEEERRKNGETLYPRATHFREFTLEAKDLVDMEGGTYTYVKDDMQIVFKKHEYSTYSYLDYVPTSGGARAAGASGGTAKGGLYNDDEDAMDLADEMPRRRASKPVNRITSTREPRFATRAAVLTDAAESSDD